MGQAGCVLFLLTALGCALGGVTRHLCTAGFTRLMGERFPWGTLFVNVLGSFLLGVILGAGISMEEGALSFARLHAFLGIGFCGGLTTFSTFSLQNLSLLSKRGKGALAVNILANVALCLLVAAAGYALSERWTA
ncbi:fluoride efflux transporter CrcB [Coraliomargarita sinensis]|uniref:Fluoride-specific ion channel FluC n=1 Tax=Coraliomargarita sinensis TaxID=2174842 RepID=A0A317ZEN9_9BACT|nr:CrcB family protein [Coraliomargarita sinensis]PXA03242.1 fluoride efflux transporter CrcB [Coraliomargarita sinensis]